MSRQQTRWPRRKTSSISLLVDPTDISHHVSANQHAFDASTFDALTSITLAKASSVIPNQSLAPLKETIMMGDTKNMVEVIPDMPMMPGGAPKSGIPFLAGSFRDLYEAPITGPNPSQMVRMAGQDGTMVVPARELDVISRYAQLMSNIPTAAAVYALFDFFLINADEDMAIVELLDDEEKVAAIMEVENGILMQRLVGMGVIVFATVFWSYLTYHPVPFNELYSAV